MEERDRCGTLGDICPGRLLTRRTGGGDGRSRDPVRQVHPLEMRDLEYLPGQGFRLRGRSTFILNDHVKSAAVPPAAWATCSSPAGVDSYPNNGVSGWPVLITSGRPC